MVRGRKEESREIIDLRCGAKECLCVYYKMYVYNTNRSFNGNTNPHTHHFLLSQHQPASSSTLFFFLLFLHLSGLASSPIYNTNSHNPKFHLQDLTLFQTYNGVSHLDSIDIYLFFFSSSFCPPTTAKLVLISNPFFFSQFCWLIYVFRCMFQECFHEFVPIPF